MSPKLQISIFSEAGSLALISGLYHRINFSVVFVSIPNPPIFAVPFQNKETTKQTTKFIQK